VTPARATAVVAALCAGAIALALGTTRAAQSRLPPDALVPPAAFPPLPLARIDAHQRFGPAAVNDAVRLAELNGVRAVVNLSGGSPGGALEAQLAAARPFGARVLVLMGLDRAGCCSETWARREAARIAAGKALGARGVALDADRVEVGESDAAAGADPSPRIPLDAAALEPLWEACAALHLPVVLDAGAEGEAVRLVERHPAVAFLGGNFAGGAGDPAAVARLMDRLPNLSVDTAGGAAELGQRAAAARAALLSHPDRVLFGTGVRIVAARDAKAVVYASGEPYLLETDGRRGKAMARFFDGYFRFLETRDPAIPSPTPAKVEEDIEGIGLPREALERIYRANAERLLGLKLPEER
jgi:Amidohydrolase